MEALNNDSVARLCTAFASLNSEQDVRDFLEDLCTIKEILDMASRLDAALLLESGKSYTEVSDTLSTSSATISRVNKALHYGTGGYKAVIEHLKGTDTPQTTREKHR